MKVLSLPTIRRYERMAKRLGVSVVARSKRGFMSAFKKAGGKISGLSPYWRRKRENFIKRHYAQVKKRKEPLFKNNKPTRRHLAFIFWAWSPAPAKLRKAKTNPYKNSKYTYKRLTSKKKFDPKSFRTIRTGRKTLLRIGCPRGKWMSRRKRCRVGTRAFELLTKKNPDPVWKKYGSVQNYLKSIDEARKGPIHVGNGIIVSNYGKTIFIPNDFYEKHKSKLNESRYKKKVTSEGVEFSLKKNPFNLKKVNRLKLTKPKKKFSGYNQKHLKAGIKVEMEHTRDRELAAIIAANHLDEMPDYYIRLKRMERKNPDQDDVCYACGKRIRGKPNVVITSDGSRVYVGSDCFRRINISKSGYVPKKGGPRLFRNNPDVEYHDRTNRYRGVTYMSVGHEGDGILWIYKNGKILTQDSIADEDGEEITHDTAFGPGWFWQGRYETSSRTLSVLPPFRSEDRKVPVKLLNLLISEFRPKKILAFI